MVAEPRHPGLDPGSRCLRGRREEAGPRVKPGVTALAACVILSACSLAPRYERPAPPVPASWPVGDAYLRQSEAA